MNYVYGAAGARRYSTPEMGSLWSETTKLDLWCKVETAAVEARLRPLGGPKPSEETEMIIALLKKTRYPTPQEVAAEEAVSRHDVVAFLRAWRTNIADYGSDSSERSSGGRASAQVHLGMTSSDLVDSANGVRWGKSASIIAREGRGLVKALAAHALEHRLTPRVARTHGQWAEESSWGHWVADRTLLVQRAVWRVERAGSEAGKVQLSGPVGDYKRVTRREEEDFATLLGIATGTNVSASDSSLQVVARDGLVELMGACVSLCAAVAAVAMEVRLGAQSEVGELAEPIGSGQIGSSSMPHKRNPVKCEQTEGLYNTVKAATVAVQDGVVLWGERDISHSSVERVAVPMVLGLTHYLTRQMTGIVEGLVVDSEAMLRNLTRARPVLDSGAALTWLTEQGVEPEIARDLVRLSSGQAADFGDRIELVLPKMARGWLKQWNPESDEARAMAAVNWAGLGTALRAKPGDCDHLWTQIGRLAAPDNPPLFWSGKTGGPGT